MRQEYDVIVAGTGPGGASAAMELAKAGKKVLMIEKGADDQWVGNTLAALFFIDMWNGIPLGHPMMVRGITTGGSSLMYCGTATVPAPWIKEKTGIDLGPIADETIEELNIRPLPERLVGQGAKTIMKAALELGMDWKLLPKFVNPDKCVPDCGVCMLGCPHGAKWTSREYIKQAQEYGADLLTNTSVDAVLRDNGKAVGLKTKGKNGTQAYYSNVVIIAAGGLGTPVILKRSGIDEAGKGFFGDPLVFTYGEYNGKGSIYDVPMTAGTWDYHASEGYLMTDLIEPRILHLMSMGMKGPQHLPKTARISNALGIMTKCKDPVNGSIDANGKVKKELVDVVWQRLNSGDRHAREILLKAGCDPKSIITSPVKAAHPGGSARVGEVVDKMLETFKIKNCYVADASIIPDELGTPVVLLAISIGKYVARNILSKQ